MFKKGDRIVIVKAYGKPHMGKLGLVVDAGVLLCNVILDDGHCLYLHKSWLSLDKHSIFQNIIKELYGNNTGDNI